MKLGGKVTDSMHDCVEKSTSQPTIDLKKGLIFQPPVIPAN
ncbi:hypothetical protein XBI1_770017 [Xenorhabdus bovienii str. Intermedium]|uniref:Uncharacterized protein n=1 Tax=Xenorhabdus bovienii str. Intermedium TaxID=1379677 RepID=A0A077QNZ5_XENBV|nr:hypothetical protein XBI1_770017 [Xenorhabdus bovienii str. Intermedium]